MTAGGHIVRMRTRKPLSREQILSALEATGHKVEEAGALLGVSGRTLRRRMAEYGMKPRVRYELEEAA